MEADQKQSDSTESKENYREKLFSVYDTGWYGVLMISPKLTSSEQKSGWLSSFYGALESKLEGKNQTTLIQKAKEQLEKSKVHETAHAMKDIDSGRFLVQIMGAGKIQDAKEILNVGIAWVMLEKKSAQEMSEIANAPTEVSNEQASELSRIDKKIRDRKKLSLNSSIAIKVLPLLIKQMEKKPVQPEKIENALDLISNFTVLTVSKESQTV